VTAEHHTGPLTVLPGQALEESTPEQLFISALLDTGDYAPNDYGITTGEVFAHRPVHEFCLRYQDTAGQAPPVHLVVEKFPSFTFVPDISPEWAAGEVRIAAENRALRKTMTAMATAVRDEAHVEAYGLMREHLKGVRTGGVTPVGVTDFKVIADAAEGGSCPVPPGHIMDLTGGHKAGQLWLVTAMWSVGKSWKLIEHAIVALEAGWDVLFFSLEMTGAGILERFHKVIVARMGHHPSMVTDEQREQLVTEWYADCGELKVYAEGLGKVNAATVASLIEHEHTLVCVDYIGRMYTDDGRPAREDYTAVSAISESLCEVAREYEVPVLAAAQLNRQGLTAGSTDLDRDPDVIIEMGRVSKHVEGVRKNVMAKNRNGPMNVFWFTRFDVTTGRFDEISGELAMQIRMDEESANPTL
jgi:replicative DNA helicase